MEKGDDQQAACNGAENADVDAMDDESASKQQLTSADDSKVKFTSVMLDGFDGKNGEAKVDIQVSQTTVGMGKEELMKYANEPFWVRLRMFLFVFFWVAWIGMLVGAIVIIILAPRCPPAPKINWYQKSPLYQVDVQKFKDSNGDGVGDLKGLASKLDYFKQQSIGALVLSNIYKSDGPNSILDHKMLDETVGTIDDFDQLVLQLREKDMHLLVDFIPNHSSKKHEWFQKSAENDTGFANFYVWASSVNGGSNEPPNKWLSKSGGGSAWTYSMERKKYYYHSSGPDQPDLNLRYGPVQTELEEILKFWLDRGVDGFRVLDASYLLESKGLEDEPLGTKESTPNPQYKDFNHLFTVDQPENSNLFIRWKEILLNYTTSTGVYKILATEIVGNMSKSEIYYGTETQPLAELPYTRRFVDGVDGEITGLQLKNIIEEATNQIPAHGWPTLLLGSADADRPGTRMGETLVDPMHMVAVLAKGTPITYYADELGISDSYSSAGSSPESVMLWSNASNAGFTDAASTSFKVNDNYKTHNVETQSKDKDSHLGVFGRLLALRGQPALNFGLQEFPVVTNDTFSLLRVRKGSPGYLVAINLKDNNHTLDFTNTNKHLPEMARVEVRSGNIKDGPFVDGDHPKIALNDVRLGPHQAVVFSFVPVFE